MDLAQLKEAGAFVEPEPIKVSVTWERLDADGQHQADTFDVWVRRRSFGMIDRIMAGDEARARSAEMISACVLLGEKREPLDYQSAYQLQPSLAWVLVDAINRTSNPKARRPTTSGTSSSSPVSAAEPSPKPASDSVPTSTPAGTTTSGGTAA